MIRNGRNDVDELSYEAVTLERSWSPFLRCLKFTGVAYDWFAKVEGCHSSAARHIISFAVSVLAVVNNAYFFIQLAIVKWEELETTKLVSMLSICAIHIPPILTAFTLWHRRQIWVLFDQWKTLESDLKCFNGSRIKSAMRTQYSVHFCNVFFGVVSLSIWNVMEPDFPCFFSHYCVLSDIFGLYPLVLVQSVSVFFSLLWHTSMTELLPSTFFFHAGCAVENLRLEWETRTRNGASVQRIWTLYGTIFRLVDRANDLFGSAMVISDANILVMMCILTFLTVKYWWAGSNLYLLVSTLLVIMLLRKLWMNSLTWHLTACCQKLRRSVTDRLGVNWYWLAQEDRDFILSFFSVLQDGEMVIRPLNLYSITPGNLLSMLTLVATYIVLLFESIKWNIHHFPLTADINCWMCVGSWATAS